MKFFRRPEYARPQDQDQSKLGTTWDDVEGMIKMHAFPKWAGRLLGIVSMLVVASLIIGGLAIKSNNDLANSNRALVQQIKAGAIANCNAGNRARGTNKLIWDDFLNILITNPNTAKTRTSLITEIGGLGLPANVTQGLDAIVVANWTNNPNDVKISQQFETYIAAHEYPVDCAKVYANLPGYSAEITL